MSPLTVVLLTVLLASYLWIERYVITPPYFFIYYVLFSFFLFVVTA